MPQAEPAHALPSVTVHVSFANGQLRSNPQMAYVRVGQNVKWKVTSAEEVVWRVYFDHGSPFSQSEGHVKGSHGDIDLGLAEEPGNYKYGVRIEDPERAERFVDDDPVLVVQR